MASTENAEKVEVSTSSDVIDTPIPLGYHEGSIETEVVAGPPLVLAPENLNSYGSSDLNGSAYYVKKDICDAQAVKGRCGLYNLGNTCFMNSGIQCLMSNMPLVKFLFTYYQTNKKFDGTLLGQFKKLFVKIWSGQYTILYPTEFKHTLGLYHPQFQDYRQHDCQEFLALLLDTLHEQLNFRHKSSNQISGAGPSTLKQPIKFEHNIINKHETNQKQAVKDQLNKVCHSKLTIENDIELKDDTDIHSSSPRDGDIKNGVQCSTTQTSEDSNHSNISEQSSDSEQCSVIKNLKLRSSPVAGHSNVNVMKDDLARFRDKNGAEEVEREMSYVNEENKLYLKKAESLQDIDKRSSVDMTGKLPKASSDNDLVKLACISEGVATSRMLFESTKLEINSEVNKMGDRVSSIKGMALKPGEGTHQNDPPVILNNAVVATCVPSLEDIYAKETKTLNTNVLATEYMSEPVTTDSDKFAKTDNTTVVQDYGDMEDGIVHNDIRAPCKKDVYKPSKLKDVNIRVDKKSRLPKGTNSTGEILSAEKEDCFLLTNVKRMKFEGTEKNLQMQEMSKIQKGKLSFNEEVEKCTDKNTNSFSHRAPDLLMSTGVESDGESEMLEDQDVDADMEISDIDQYDPSDREECLSATCHGYSTADVLAAEEAWHKYLMKNDSVIVDTFQGQFKSTVVCGKCNQVSVTFEPFMYLSVPIPHAMERQLCIIFISPSAPPTRYLLTLHKQDRIQKVKEVLRTVLARDTHELILSEVLNHHISRILEDNTMLRFINDTTRTIYAFEMDPLMMEDIQSDDISTSDTPTLGNSNISSNKDSNVGDIFSQMGSFTAESAVYQPAQFDVASSTMTCESTSVLGESDQNVYKTESTNIDLAGTGLWEWNQTGGNEGRCGSLETEPGDAWPVVDSTTSGNACDETYREKDWTLNEDNLVSSTSAPMAPVTSDWKSCAICLEELTDCELMVHTTCGGTFCPNCLEMSVQHYRDSSYCCPVCSTPAEITEDFVPLVDAAKHKPKNRIVTIPISFRCDRDFTGAANPFMFAHPHLLNLPSNLTGSYAYSALEKLIPFQREFQILLTDGQGLHCSRCLYMEHCSGCVIPQDGEVVLRPGDNLTVSISMVTMEELDQLGHVVEHESMKQQRSNDPVTLMDCFTAFTESEELDENNPWFCPHCKENQQAKKTMTVWRYPDSLIIHLKRFLFHELSSTKVDNKVVFPLDTLELEDFVSGPRTKNLNYRLYSLVCHFGGANSGHYTAYSRHPVDDTWYYYNDETVNCQSPGEDEYSSTYVLFYQRKGTEETLQIPDELDLSLIEQETTDHVTSMPAVSYHPPEAELTLTVKLPKSGESTPCQSSSSLSVTASTGLMNIASSSEDSVVDSKTESVSSQDVATGTFINHSPRAEQVEADSTQSSYDFYS